MLGIESPQKIIIVLVTALIVLGPSRLPEIGRSLGHGIREFKDIAGSQPTRAQVDAGRQRASPRPPASPYAGSPTEPRNCCSSVATPALTYELRRRDTFTWSGTSEPRTATE